MLDAKIMGGTIVDGTGTEPYVADVGIKADRIVAIGDLSEAESVLCIDAKGLMVTPGFIDIHSHTDQSIYDYPDSDSKLRQGVTTEITGNCGYSAAPHDPGWGESSKELPWTDPESFFAHLKKSGIGPNLAMLVGHGNLRLSVIGASARRATDDDLENMRILLEECLEQGCIGLSSGLIYPPGQFADSRELAYLAASLDPGQMYATHIRNESSLLFESLQEAFQTATQANCRLEVSHLKACGKDVWGQIPRAIEMFEEYRKRGFDVGFDAYPYIATQTGIRQLFPPWTQDGGRSAFVQRLLDASTRKRIIEDLRADDLSWENIYRSAGAENIIIGACKNPEYSGRSITEIASSKNVSVLEAMCTVAAEEDGEAGIITFEMNEKDVQTVLAHRLCSICSDGSGLPETQPEHVHPRNYGAFAWFLAEYVIGKRIIGIEEAVRKMTSLPASRAGLYLRGTLLEGTYADIAVFDSTSLRANASFDIPRRHATGFRSVFVNGKLAVDNDRLTGTRSGMILNG